jgi:hypothetical protein
MTRGPLRARIWEASSCVCDVADVVQGLDLPVPRARRGGRRVGRVQA